MDSESGRPATPLTEHPARYEFGQAVRLIERAVAFAGEVGRATRPSEEPVRFQVVASTAFPPGAIVSVGPGDDMPVMTVAFMGLTGPTGVLPRHVDAELARRRRSGDHAMAAFQNIFDHRLISLFHRAWAGSRIALCYERRHVRGDDPHEDPFALALLGVAGVATGRLATRSHVPADLFIRYAGCFASGRATADQIEGMVEDLLGRATRLVQFAGHWTRLAPEDESSLGSANMELGRTVMLGSRLRHAEAGLRLEIEPVTLEEYVSLLPGGESFKVLTDLVRALVGPHLDVLLSPRLKAAEIPPCRLGDEDVPPRLGWTTFLIDRAPERDLEDVELPLVANDIRPSAA